MTVTGWHLDGTPLIFEPRQDELGQLYIQVFGQVEAKPDKKPAHFSAIPTDEILAAAMSAQNGAKFAKLWRGDWENDYPSQSEADLALASMLAFYTGPDEKLLEGHFRQSGLYREKWERGDYRERVLAKALDQDEFYSWGISPECEAEIIAMVTESSVEIPKSQPRPQKKEKPNQTQRLIKIAEAGELWRTPDCTAFATIRVGNHMENMPVGSTAYRRWLARLAITSSAATRLGKRPEPPPWRLLKVRRWRELPTMPTCELPDFWIGSTSTWATTNGMPWKSPPLAGGSLRIRPSNSGERRTRANCPIQQRAAVWISFAPL